MSAVEDPAAATATRTRTFAWQDPAATAAEGLKLPGLQYIRAIAEGTLPPPPVAQLLGFEIVEAEEGRAVFAIAPAEWMYNPIGVVHGGIAATILDSCMGCAVHTTLDRTTGDVRAATGHVVASTHLNTGPVSGVTGLTSRVTSAAGKAPAVVAGGVGTVVHTVVHATSEAPAADRLRGRRATACGLRRSGSS